MQSQSFRECIGDAIIRAVKRDDYTAIISLRKIFSFLAKNLVNYNGVNSERMESMLDDIWMCLDQGVDKSEIEHSVMAVVREPSNEDNYDSLSNKVDYEIKYIDRLICSHDDSGGVLCTTKLYLRL